MSAFALFPMLPITASQDFWELPFQGGGNAGDCEDYVLQKRQMLLARGVPNGCSFDRSGQDFLG